MGEDSIVQIAERFDRGETVKKMRDMRGVAYALGASEEPPTDSLLLPSFEEVHSDKFAFAEATKIDTQHQMARSEESLDLYHGRFGCLSPALDEDGCRAF